jgi:Sulphur transport
MNVELVSVIFLIAALLVGIMGFAIQRGATCTVAAVDEWVNQRRVERLISMIEASLWVTGGLVIANALHISNKMPAGYPVTISVVTGGLLLGMGAYINRACVFGAIARLGSGEWSYVATPIGFYLGCVIYSASPIGHRSPIPFTDSSPIFQLSPIFVIIVLMLLLLRLLWPVFTTRHNRDDNITHRVWSPHMATTVIGITFLFLLLMMGAWAYTDVLAELARGLQMDLITRALLLIALFVGALIGGWTSGRFGSARISFNQVGKCLIGGALMGFGSVMIPGSNDGLILLGMPLLWPYAWVAFATMCVSIGFAITLKKRSPDVPRR